VIRGPSRENSEPSSSTPSYSSTINPPKNDRYSPNGPPSFDSGVTLDPEPKMYLREHRTFFDKDHFLESASKDSGYVEYQRVRDLELLKEIHERHVGDLRLDSPASKDSGYSERPKHYKVTRIKYHPPPERSASYTYLSSNSSDNVTYCPSLSSQADPENSLATTKEGKLSFHFFLWKSKKGIKSRFIVVFRLPSENLLFYHSDYDFHEITKSSY